MTEHATTLKPASADRITAKKPVAPPAVHAARAGTNGFKTVLVASCGWPTETTKPSRRKTARR